MLAVYSEHQARRPAVQWLDALVSPHPEHSVNTKSCHCQRGYDAQTMRLFGHGEARCTACGQVWVPPGWRGERVQLFPDFRGTPDPLGTPSADDLNRWFKCDPPRN